MKSQRTKSAAPERDFGGAPIIGCAVDQLAVEVCTAQADLPPMDHQSGGSLAHAQHS
jgi:hypothetical protein